MIWSSGFELSCNRVAFDFQWPFNLIVFQKPILIQSYRLEIRVQGKVSYQEHTRKQRNLSVRAPFLVCPPMGESLFNLLYG